MTDTPIKGKNYIKEFRKNAPKTPGVYRMLNDTEEVLYVGKAKNLFNRIGNYTSPEGLPYRIQRMISHTVKMEIILTDTESEALLLEANLIKKLQPRYNILLKDDKAFPYIQIDMRHPYPRITKHRGKKESHCHYYGPFASAGDVNQAITTLQKIFLLRPCSDNIFDNRQRPCLEYQIKRCSGPCVNKISQEDYQELIFQAKEFLSGKSSKVQAKLAQKMEEHSQKMEYEEAARYRDRIAALTQIQSHQSINIASIADADVIGLYREGNLCCVQIFFFRHGHNYGNKSYFPINTEEESEADIIAVFIGQFYQTNVPPKQLLLSHPIQSNSALEEALSNVAGHKVAIHVPKIGDKAKIIQEAIKNAKEALDRKMAEHASKTVLFKEIQTLFALPDLPKRIEVYDNSHTFGQFPIGGMIVAGQEGFIKNAYRRYTIKTKINAGDDYGMMREVLTRRFERLLKECPERTDHIWPDLLVIDGGKGHMQAVLSVLKQLNITDQRMVCISKGPARKVGEEFYHQPHKDSFQLPSHHKVAHYMEMIRDEAHRYAIGSHRRKRGKELIRSPLEEIEGVGAKRKKLLLGHFGSVKAIQAASLSDIQNIEGINAKTAQKIYDYFRTE